jgi:hypothetical protein
VTLLRVVPNRKVLLVVAALVVGSSSGACRDPTEIQLDIWTNVPCTDSARWHGIAVYTGHPGLDLEQKAPAMTSTTCDASGHIGTLVVVPKDSDNEEVGIRVVAGLASAPEDCGANGYAGCIVARRTLNYVPHTTTDLRIDLDSLCIGEGCELLQTCVNGACADARLIVPPGPADAASTAPTVRCGNNAVRCATTGDVCCLQLDVDAETATGSCRAPTDCPPLAPVLYCDDNTDCPNGTVCCVAYAQDQGGLCRSVVGYGGGTECVPPENCGTQIVLCEERMPCGDGGNLCSFAGNFPGYASCCLQPQPVLP